jgi:hypothetical protein
MCSGFAEKANRIFFSPKLEMILYFFPFVFGLALGPLRCSPFPTFPKPASSGTRGFR